MEFITELSQRIKIMEKGTFAAEVDMTTGEGDAVLKAFSGFGGPKAATRKPDTITTQKTVASKPDGGAQPAQLTNTDKLRPPKAPSSPLANRAATLTERI